MAALEAGCDGVEVDVRRTADGELVLMHDALPIRTTVARGGEADRARRRPVELSRLDELRGLGLRAPDGAEVPGSTVPLLADVLWPALHHGAVVVVDVKESPPSGRVWSSLAAELSDIPVGWRSRVVAQSRSVRELRELGRRLPGIATSVITWGTARDEPDGGGPSLTSRPWWTASASTIARDHAHGHHVLAWTVNKQGRMLDLVRRGVDGIITDEPLLLRDRVGGTDRPAALGAGGASLAPRG